MALSDLYGTNVPKPRVVEVSAQKLRQDKASWRMRQTIQAFCCSRIPNRLSAGAGHRLNSEAWCASLSTRIPGLQSEHMHVV